MSKTVLVVEDNGDERTLYTTIAQHFGYEVIETDNAQDGIRLARENKPDIILLDVHTTELNGVDVVTHLKSDAATARIPIIAITDHRVAASSVRDSGADAYLPKPVLPKALGQASRS